MNKDELQRDRIDLRAAKTTDGAINQATSPPVYKEGDLIAGKYRCMGIVGCGGMSTLYKAHDGLLDRIVAVKVLHPHLAQDESMLKRFVQEGRVISQLNHPNIVRVHEFIITPEGHPCIVMDFIEGSSLREIVRSIRTLPLEQVEAVLQQVGSALAHAHAKGILHRDLKPSNIMIASDPSVAAKAIVVDFGIAKIAEGNSDDPHLTATGQVLGSPVYMSPEQCRGMQADERSEMYSLGCLLYECLMGVPPFDGANSLEVMYKKMSGEAPTATISQSHGALGAKLEYISNRLMEQAPDKRFQSAQEVLDCLCSPTFSLSKTKAERSTGKERLFGLLGIAVLIVMFGMFILFVRQQLQKQISPFPAAVSAHHSASTDLDLSNTRAGDNELRALDAPDLRRLKLRGDDITNLGVNSLSKFSHLQLLDLANTKVDDGAGDAISKLKELEVLGVDNTAVTDVFLKSVPPGIKWLSLTGDRITASGLGSLQRLPLLEGLAFEGVSLNARMVSELTQLPKLQQLYLSGPSITDDTVRQLSQLKHLRELSLNESDVTDASAPSLNKLSNLELLCLDGSKITGEGLVKLEGLTKLKRLQCKSIPLTETKLDEFKKAHPGCIIQSFADN